ncbi:MAG: hypothetical protein H0X01_08925, partial [Nitrospira sp.]|nr:hypothetical protein [Nitrospira sp.]
MMARHLHLIDVSNATDPRGAEIHEAFTAVWGSDPDSLEVQHRDALIRLDVTPEAARREFSLR